MAADDYQDPTLPIGSPDDGGMSDEEHAKLLAFLKARPSVFARTVGNAAKQVMGAPGGGETDVNKLDPTGVAMRGPPPAPAAAQAPAPAAPPAAAPGTPNPQKTALVQAVLKSSPVARKALASRNSAPPTDRDDEGNRIEPAQEAAAAPAAAPAPSSPNPYDLVKAKLLAQQASDADELKKAQAQGMDQARVNAGIDAWSKRHGVAGGSGGVDPESFVKNVLARRAQRQENAKELKETDADDPGSEKSLRTIKAAEAQFGLKPGTWSGKVAASELPDLLSGQKTVTDLQKERESRKSIEGEGAAERANRLQIEREKNAAELARAKIGHPEGANGLTPIPAQEQAKLDALNQALDSNAKLRELHAKTGGIGGKIAGTLGVGDAARYADAAKIEAPAIAAGSAPNARESPQLIKEAEQSLPGSGTFSGRAGANFDEREESLKRRRKELIRSFAASGYDTRGLDRDEGAPSSASHYRYSPDRKQRVPTDANGTPMGPPERNPGS